MGTNSGIKGEISRQRGDVEIDWKIENFSSMSMMVDNYYASPSFSFCGRSWYLRLYPKGQTKRQSEDFIRLYLIANDADPSQKIRYSLGVKAENGETEVWISGNRIFDKADCGWGTNKCILTSELLRRKDELIPLNVLTLTITLNTCEEITFKKGTKDVSVQTAAEDNVEDKKEETAEKTITKNVSIQTEAEDNAAENAKDETSEKTGCEKVLQDIRKLWISGDSSDVVLQVRDVEFKVHRAILSARTPVLCAMFQHDTAEKASGKVTIDDCDPAVFEQLLHYIYAGAPSVLTAENACDLYVVSDKYLVKEVKTLCVRCMQNTLCLDTFCNIVKLSLMHREDELLESATDFLSRNMINVMKTVEWQRFLNEHSTWANEIMIRAMELIEARNK